MQQFAEKGVAGVVSKQSLLLRSKISSECAPNFCGRWYGAECL
jgi:hypothetical protein